MSTINLRLADEILTYIEQREAEQIAYGIYDVTMTGAEVIAGFQPIENDVLDQVDREEAICTALRTLADELHIIRFDAAAEPHEWVFRSRIAEMVRLLTKLRQRIVRSNNDKSRHRISSSKRLVEDVKFQVAARRVPKRKILANEYLEVLRGGSAQHHQVADILQEVIEHDLVKLQEISGFQCRALEEIIQAIELDPPRSVERGVVVTASTGAGKTYAFFLPVLAKMMIERCLRDQVGVKAICIYPRVALSENQLTDFVEALFHVNHVLQQHGLPQITVGIESGAAVYHRIELTGTNQEQRDRLGRIRGWTYSEQHGGYLAPFAYCVGVEGFACAESAQRLMVLPTQPDTLRCPICRTTYPFIQFSRDVMASAPPDLLIATTESLNKRLLSSKYQYLFGTAQFAAPSVIMLDEIHLQTSTAGTQVALLLRRLIARIRLGKQERGDSSNLAFVGLSATIAQPVQFAAELTGLPIPRIVEIKPHDDEMQVVGAERFIFVRAEDSEDTAVLSTLIQTAMCVIHTMPQPPVGSPLKRYRTFGFVQSLDIVGRWRYQMEDAEKVRAEQKDRREQQRHQSVTQRNIEDIPLYMYRYPPYNRDLFPQFFGTRAAHSCDCEHHGPSQGCPFFQAGECWWVLSQLDKALREPMTIKRKSGRDRDKPIEAGDDLIITTSALEVGYDDEALMCVLQYTAPTNVASFVQRKGRGGRKVGTRPIVVTVLSPYKPTDLFLFRNHHLLTDPTFRKLPLNAQNRYLQRIHGFYALFDWLAYRAGRDGSELDFDDIQAPSLSYLLKESANIDVLLSFKDYMRQAFTMNAEALTSALTDEDEGLLVPIFEHGLIDQSYRKLVREQERFVKPRELLRAYLPEKLFSDINLPEVRVDYRDNDTRISAESISLAISETIPGNVTFRGGAAAAWVPPQPVYADVPLVSLQPCYIAEELRFQPDTASLPQRALRLVGIDPRRMHDLTIYRPHTIYPKPFSRDYESTLWYANPDTGELHKYDGHETSQTVQQLAHSTSAYPISATYIQSRRLTPTPAYTFSSQRLEVMTDPLGRKMVQQIVLHSDEADNLNPLKVYRIILGSQYTLKFHKGQENELRGVVGFCPNEESLTNCALGYEMTTEGLMLDLSAHVRDGFQPSASIQAWLRSQAIRHRFITELSVEHGENFFAAENLASLLLTIADRRCHEMAEALDDLRGWLSINNDSFNHEMDQTIRNIYLLSRKKHDAVWQLLKADRYLGRFLDIYAEIHADGPLYQQYLRDSFQYSVTVALKQMAQEVAGVEALNYVAAWTELHVDFEGRAADRIWLYEIGMGGIGVMRATHTMLRDSPDRLWTELAHKMTRCPTAQEEAMLRHLLAQPSEWLEQCEGLVNQVTQAKQASQRQRALDALIAAVRRQIGVPVPPEQVRSLLRVFIADYTQIIDGQPLINWQLFREINHEFLPRCEVQLGREPSFVEARALLYASIIQDAPPDQQPLYLELRRLLRLYKEEYEPAPAEREVRQAFENAVERRLLLTCRGSCPTCLDDRSGEIESPSMARLLLSRSLLAEWLTHVRTGQRLDIGMTDDLAQIVQRLKGIFEQGGRVAYLRVSGENLGALCATISYLTDAGVDTALGLVYPMITDVQTIYLDDLHQHPLVEVTVRPIE